MNLNQVTVPSIDVERSVVFYKKLGLQLIVKTNSHYARFECPNCEATISIHQVETLPEGEGVIIYFEIENLDNKVKELIEKGIVFDKKPENKSWLWREAHLRDPYRNRIILFYAGRNRKNPPWRINPSE